MTDYTPQEKRNARVAVESYLDWLATLNPDAFKGNRDSAETLQAKIEEAASQTDRLILIQRLLSLQELEAKKAEGAQVRQAFVDQALVFASIHGISEQAWRMMGVPYDVLRDAGIVVGPEPKQAVQTEPKPRHKMTPERSREMLALVDGLDPLAARKALQEHYGYSETGAKSALQKAKDMASQTAPPESLRADRIEDVRPPRNGTGDLALSG